MGLKNLKKKIMNLRFTHKNFGKKVVHVEDPHLFGENLKKHLKKYNSKCYCLTPANYDYINSVSGITISKKEFSKFLKEYYLSLKKRGINLQPHVHLSKFPEFLPYSRKEKMIKEAYKFFTKELGIKPKEFVFGWYASDKDSENIVKNLGMKIIPSHFHIYDRWLK